MTAQAWVRGNAVTVGTVALVLAWGSTFAAIKVGLRSSPPMLFAGWRALIGGVVMVVAAAAFGGRPNLRRNLGTFTVLALLNVIGFYGLQTLALDDLPSGLSAVLIYLQPVLTAALAAPILGERVGLAGVAGLLVAFAGIVVVSLHAMEGRVSGVGIVLAIGSALAWSLGTIVFKRQAAQVDSWWAVAIPFVAGGVVLTAYGTATEGDHVTWSWSFGWGLGWAAIIGTSLAWMLWFALVGSGGAARTAANIFFVPLVAIVIGALFLGESVGVTLLVGAALVALGVYLVNRPAAR